MKLENFKIGDIVQVTHQPSKEEFEKYKVTYHWSENQERLLGKTLKIRDSIYNNGVYHGFVSLSTMENGYLGTGVPFFSLKKIKKAYSPKWKSVWK